jgi:alpha-glucuronidase
MLISVYLLILTVALVAAEDGLNAWLRYAPLPSSHMRHARVPSGIVTLNSSSSSPVNTAGYELKTGIESMLGQHCVLYHVSNQWTERKQQPSASIIVGTFDQYDDVYGGFDGIPDLKEDGFWLDTTSRTVQILGQNERGALYGAFQYLAMVAQGNFSKVAYSNSPSAPIRWINQWDNMDGRIERGYGGASLWFANYTVKEDLSRAAQYARLCASIGLNAIVVNKVNANASILTDENIIGLGRLADEFRPYGVQLALSLNFASPNQTEPNIGTFDPLLPEVRDWWNNKSAIIYKAVPDFAGYLLKANSEGQPGPAEYNRTLSDGANMIATSIELFGGIVMFRSFVYDYATLDRDTWTDDRATEAYTYIDPLDGHFNENVVVQTKFGPLDFQVREAPHPLFANLRQSNQAIELQISPEYLGQNDHLVYQAPLWKTVLDFDLRVDHEQSLVRDIVSGERFNRSLGGYAGVAGVGTNLTWLGSHLALSNLYSFGRLAWDPAQDSEAVLRNWARLTFGNDQRLVDTITNMSMESWPAYENYTGNLGMLTLADVSTNTHYGPNAQSSETDPWGFWTRADSESIGMDRSLSNGTGFVRQYPNEVFEIFEGIETTPDDLLLFFHHVNYTTQLHSGKTVIQHIYDAHYNGAETAQKFVVMLESLRGLIDKERFEEMMFKQTYQAGHALIWRDAINDHFYRLSGIPDEAGRVCDHRYRIEGESMMLDGYKIYDVNPFETASGSKAIVTCSNVTAGTASAYIDMPSGIYDIAVNHYDLVGGRAVWQFFLNDVKIGEIIGDAMDGILNHDSTIFLDGNSAIRKVIHGIEVAHGDLLKIVGTPDGSEPAPIDYISILPLGVAT